MLVETVQLSIEMSRQRFGMPDVSDVMDKSWFKDFISFIKMSIGVRSPYQVLRLPSEIGDNIYMIEI